ncbi:MAG: hypothetical protein ACREBG_06265 [Pyrinomonadaceae bacterium]
MKRRILFYLIVFFAVVFFDSIASFASKTLEFDYAKLFWASWCLYALVGFLGCKRFSFLDGIAAGFVAGLADSTVGWFLSSAIGPYMPSIQQQYSVAIVVIAIIVVTVMGTFFGLVGAVFCKLMTKVRGPAAA